jgi:hypothetical protein
VDRKERRTPDCHFDMGLPSQVPESIEKFSADAQGGIKNWPVACLAHLMGCHVRTEIALSINRLAAWPVKKATLAGYGIVGPDQRIYG